MQDSGKIQAPPLIQFLAPDDNKQAPCLHKLCYFADLNGDGILEIIAGERQGKSLRYAEYYNMTQIQDSLFFCPDIA